MLTGKNGWKYNMGDQIIKFGHFYTHKKIHTQMFLDGTGLPTLMIFQIKN